MRKRKGLLFNSEQSGWVTVENAGGARTVPELGRKMATRLTGSSAREYRPFADADEWALASVDAADGRSAHSQALGDFVRSGNARRTPQVLFADAAHLTAQSGSSTPP